MNHTDSRGWMTRRGFMGRASALAGAAVTLPGVWTGSGAHAEAASRPDSRFQGVQIGVISYSFESMPDQSAEAVLRYCLDAGVNAVELMGDPAEAFAGIPGNPNAARYFKVRSRGFTPNPPPLTPAEERERAEVLALQADYQKVAAAWRAKASMDRFEQLGTMFRAAGVRIYAFKPNAFESFSTDAEVDYGMRAARALGADHVTAELPTDPAQSLRLGAAALKHRLRIGYHQHRQATPTLWDNALAQSRGNGINLDLGHFIAAGDYDPLAFIRAHHDRITSMHLKDRKSLAHGGANLPWGTGDTPLAAVLRLMRAEKYAFPATIELEYAIPAGSDAVREVRNCVAFCRGVLSGAA